jgi:hypothetical protein
MATIAVSLGPSLSDGLTKNFYCYAHGSPDTLCNAAGDVKITAGGVAALLGNRTGFPGAVIPSNPYRFVFLDACSTARDNQWRHAFGIMSLGPADSAARSILGAQAFVGWSDEKSDWMGGSEVPGDWTVNQSMALQSAYTATLQIFFSDWMNGTPLSLCIRHATDPSHVPCPLPIPAVSTFTIGPPYISDRFTVQNRRGRYGAQIWIYGHPGLTRSGLDSTTGADNPMWYSAPGNTR